MDAKPTGKLIGYARVSTKDQDLRMQITALEKAGCWNIYKEHRSATRGPRPELELALMDLRPGDTLVVWKLDRFARSSRELYVLLDRVNAAGATFKSLTEQWDLTTAIGRLLLGLMGILAEFEASLTAERTAFGIKALQDQGYMYGAQPKLSPEKAKQMLKLRKGGMSRAEAGRKFKVSPATVRNYELRAKVRKMIKR